MNPARWARVKSCLGRALELPDSGREAWLAAECAGDPALHAEVRSLLRVASQAGGFLSLHQSLAAHDDAAPPAEPAPMPRVLGPYQLIERLGAGGMGEVFRARHLALGRDAALKLLPRRFAPELRARLVREAEAASRVQHPAIATFHEAGEAAGEAFIAMEYVRGQTLRQRLVGGPLPVDESLALMRCVLEALEHAHAAGVLHRDVKPENIMVTGPRAAKLLDFGLARHFVPDQAATAASAATAALGATSTGVAGTVGYMAPEQLTGGTLDARTDVYQAGVTFYEMVSGRPAFPGSSPLERLAAVMTRDPDLEAIPWDALPPGTPDVLRRALARDPAARYPTAAAFLRDLDDLAEGRVATGLPRLVAVADFARAGGDPDAEWLGAAMGETLRAGLARLEGLTIVPRDRVAAAAAGRSDADGDARADAIRLGLALGCGWVLTGAISKEARQLTVRAELVEAPTARLVHREEATGAIEDLFALQERLVRAMAAALGLSASATAVRAASVDVQEYVARARLLLDRLEKGAVDHARELLERAVALDAGYAPALVALANAYSFRSIATTDPRDLERGLHYADRAIAADPAQAEAYTWRGYVLMRQARYDEAAAAHGRAAALDPGNASALYFGGSSLLFAGRRAEALPILQRSLALDPRSGMNWLALGDAHLGLGQLAEARVAFGRARATEAHAHPARYPCVGAAAHFGEVRRLEGALDEARASALEGLEAAERSDHAYRDTFRAYALVVLGRTALDAGDAAAARAAFQQALGQARGRPRTRSCGHLVSNALAGLARADRDPAPLDEARALFDARDAFNFEPFFGMCDEWSLVELARAARALGRRDVESPAGGTA